MAWSKRFTRWVTDRNCNSFAVTHCCHSHPRPAAVRRCAAERLDCSMPKVECPKRSSLPISAAICTVLGKGATTVPLLAGTLRSRPVACYGSFPRCSCESTKCCANWDDDHFVRLLPLLRLAMADLTPRETDRVAKHVAEMLGTESLQLTSLPDMTVEEMLRAVDVNRLVRATLQAEGLEVFGE